MYDRALRYGGRRLERAVDGQLATMRMSKTLRTKADDDEEDDASP